MRRRLLPFRARTTAPVPSKVAASVAVWLLASTAADAWAQDAPAGGALSGAVEATPAPVVSSSTEKDAELAEDRKKIRGDTPPVPVEEDLPKRVDTPSRDGFLRRYVLESARVDAVPLHPDFLTFSIHGEYEARLRVLTDLPLEPPIRGALPTDDDSDPGDPTLLGQNAYLYHWLRLNGRIAFRDDIIGVGQIDIPRGMIVGQKTRFVDRSRDPMDDYDWYDVHPRELYVEFRSPIGVFRVGQQTSHWGQGILANDGDHPQMFGDTLRGALVERLLYATRPLGADHPLMIVVAGDVVFEDNTGDLMGNSPEQPEGDLAGQAVAAIAWREDWAEIGIYGVYRHQQRELMSGVNPYDETLDVGVIDLAGQIRGRVPGMNAYAYAAGEAALVFGRTNYVRSTYVNQLEPTSEVDDENILSFGASTTFGLVHVTKNAKETWGDLVAEIEWGYATGDADPFDGESRRFTFDTNHNVGLVLFDHVMQWKTARSATIAQDDRIVARPNPGLQFLPSNGGVFGATYLNPRVVFRPVRMLDVKLGLLWAHSTSDFVDPYQVGALGDYKNFDGGDPTQRDLGVEIDAGVDARIPLERTVTLELGAEGGVLFAGHAFDDETGRRLPEQMLLNTKVGLQF